MKKLVFSALALSATTATGLASDSEWTSLDQQIEALTSSLAVDNHGGPAIFGRIRTYYDNNSDADQGGWSVLNARLGAKGSVGDYSYKLQVDFAREPELLDAYVDFPIGGQVMGRWGQFKANVSHAALTSSGNLFFRNRSAVGALFSGRSQGFHIGGEFDMLDWGITIQNGSDGVTDELFTAGRISFDVLGSGSDMVEGAIGGTEEMSATASIAFFDDGGADDSDGTLLEIHGGTNVYSFGLEILDLGDNVITSQGTNQGLEGDSSPITLMGTYMLQPDAWELGIRYQDWDTSTDTSAIEIGVNNYLDGHNLKWQLQYTSVSDDVADADVISIGLQAAF